MTRPATIWITGLSAAGKSTLGAGLRDELKATGLTNIDLLDGEEIRARLDRDYGYTTEERNALAMVIAEMARQSNENGMIAIVCTISHVRATRARIREHIGDFMEVFLDCPVEVAAARDYKDQYQRAMAGEIDNFIGVTEPYERSADPELVLDTASEAPDVSLKKLAAAVTEFLLASRD